MVDINNAIAVAQRLISENGRSVTLVQFDAQPADPARPWKGQADPTAAPDATLPIDAVFLDPTTGNSVLGRDAISVDLLKRIDQIMILSPGASQSVEDFDVVTDADGTEWKIEFTRTLQPGSVIVLAYIGVRR